MKCKFRVQSFVDLMTKSDSYLRLAITSIMQTRHIKMMMWQLINKERED
jgi:hypothetical protein